MSNSHSVTLDPEKCKGCTTCLRYCPTEAIRVRKGKAFIIDERCIDCGECIRVCPHGAKKAVSDSMAALEKFKVRVAIPAPALYGQFDERFSINHILSSLLELGFTDVYEVASAAELVSQATIKWMKGLDPGRSGPCISSACPAVVKLIQVRFPSLLDLLVPVIAPMEVAARIVKTQLYPGRKDVGVFFISPCAAKVSAARNALDSEGSSVDGVMGIKDLYVGMRNAMSGLTVKELAKAGPKGISWAHIDGESDAIADPRAISVSGIADIIGVLEALENGKLKNVSFIEALACPSGCVGGPLTVENPYLAKARLRSRVRCLESKPAAAVEGPDLSDFRFERTGTIRPRPALRLHQDMLKAMILMEEMEILAESLPGLDCGSCGAPSCRALAEDVAKGEAHINDCIFKLRENVRHLAEELLAIEQRQVPGMDKE